MRGKLGCGAIQFRFIPVGVGDQGTRVVGYDQLGDAADVDKRTTEAREPVGLRLASGGAGKGVAGYRLLPPRSACGERSRTRTEAPSCAAATAADKPAMPQPATTTSDSYIIFAISGVELIDENPAGTRDSSRRGKILRSGDTFGSSG